MIDSRELSKFDSSRCGEIFGMQKPEKNGNKVRLSRLRARDLHGAISESEPVGLAKVVEFWQHAV